MKRSYFTIPILLGMIYGFPLFGITIAGKPVGQYLEFPPLTRYVHHKPFSWAHFAATVVILIPLLVIFCLRTRIYLKNRKTISTRNVRGPFPWWGWLALAAGMVSWVLAWSRFPWFADAQIHTFTPLWLSYIVFVNALTHWRCGSSMLTSNTTHFLSLFPASTLFWWIFEYLNRFVQNWYYVGGTSISASEYIFYASISFSTVLPAVLGTREFLLTFPFFQDCFDDYLSIDPVHPKTVAISALLIATAGLTLIGTFPDLTYSLLWVSPLIIIVSLQTLSGEKNIFSPIRNGNWTLIVSSAVAALICGFFWEMWNYYSMAKWIYSIPYVHRFTIFEMPVLGYFGYLPFGLQCAAAGDITADIFQYGSKDR
jgi:hypothetical protein